MLAPRQQGHDQVNAGIHGAGMPQERHAQIAARRVFVDLKLRFAIAVQNVPGDRGHWLQQQVRQANEPGDLWLLRGAVFSALRVNPTERSRQARFELHDALARVFPDCEELMPVL